MVKNDKKHSIMSVAIKYREKLENKYGTQEHSLMGKCIEASDNLVRIYQRMGYKAKAKQVWVLYEYFEGCSNICYEEHWLVEIYINSKEKMFIDTTMTQFQWAFTKELPKVYINKKLPNFYLTRKPGKVTLDKCGWNDWYNYGNYENNFNYYN